MRPRPLLRVAAVALGLGLALAGGMLAGGMPAEAAAGRRMLSADEAVPFRGVGRVNIAGARFCTGTLIAPDQVLTAAHCLYHPQTGALVPPKEIRFVAGLRIDRQAAVRRVVRAMPDPDFSFGRAGPREVGSDLALLVLARPIAAKAAVPFRTGPLEAGPLAIVSYGRDRPQAPSIEAPCSVLAPFGRGIGVDCAVTEGVSGAPVFQGEGAARRVVAVVSAMGRTVGGDAVGGGAVGGGGRDVALAARVEPALDRLRQLAGP